MSPNGLSGRISKSRVRIHSIIFVGTMRLGTGLRDLWPVGLLGHVPAGVALQNIEFILLAVVRC